MNNLSKSLSRTTLYKAKRWLLILFAALTPSLVSIILVRSQGYYLSDFMPRMSDEVSYWAQINAFRAAHLNGGYFTINERSAAAGFTHFYTYGPWYPAIYGSIARVIGWNSTTILLINSLLVGLALIIFCNSANLDPKQLLLTIFLLGTMWGLLLYFYTGMQEAYQQTLSILLASIFITALRQGETTPLRMKVIGLSLISFAALMRLSWAILFLPFLALTGKKTLARCIVYVATSLCATVIIMAIANYTGSPGNNSVFDMVDHFKVSAIEGLSYLLHYILRNLGRFLFLPKPLSDVLQTYQVVILILGLVAFLAQSLLHRTQRRNHISEVTFHLYNLGITVIAACALYIIGTGGDYRLLACHLLLSLLVMVALKHYRPVLLIIGLNLVCYPLFAADFSENVLPKYEPNHSEYAAFKPIADKYLQYDPSSPNAWCNTLLFAVENYDTTLLAAIPAGIGLSFFRDIQEPILTFKSRYLLLNTEDHRRISELRNAPVLQQLATLSNLNLYLNQNTDCS